MAALAVSILLSPAKRAIIPRTVDIKALATAAAKRKYAGKAELPNAAELYAMFESALVEVVASKAFVAWTVECDMAQAETAKAA